MKFLPLLAAAILLTSCNTMIGIGRDTKEGYNWTKQKIQNSRQDNSYDQYGAPVY